jgi:hypothetical protein
MLVNDVQAISRHSPAPLQPVKTGRLRKEAKPVMMRIYQTDD